MESSSLGPQHPAGSSPKESAGERHLADEAIQPAGAPIKIVARGMTWRVKPGWEWLVSGPAAPNWQHLVAEPQAEPIKRNTAREVWRVTANGRQFFAKIYRETGPAGRLRALLRGPGCELEWRAADHAQRHHIATVEPVAYGSAGWPRLAPVSVLITRALAAAVPLHTYWQQSVIGADPGQRRRLANAVIEAAAEALARAHQGGFHHRDLHAANLLVVSGLQNRPEVVYVDLHNVRAHRRVPDRIAIRNLAQLNQWFRQWATQTDRLRFLQSYLALRNDLARRKDSGPSMRLDYRSLLKALDKAAGQHSRRLWAKRDRTAMRDNKYFCRIRTRRGWRGHAFLRAKHAVSGSRASELQFTRAQWREWLENPLEWIRVDRPGIIKESHTAYIGRGQLPVPQGPLEVVCKRARPRTFLKRLIYLFGDSRNLRTWKRGYQLLNRELPTARPLAVMERRFAGLLLDSIVMTEAIPNSKDFDALLRMDLLHEDARTQRRVKDQLIAELARLIKRMQARGFAHRDFKATNLLVQWDPERDQPPRLTLVDLDGLVLCRRLSRQERLRPLMRLNVSLDEARLVTRTDRLRFLKAFLTGFYFSHTDWRSLWRELTHMSDLKRVHKEERRVWKVKHYGRE